MPLIAVERKFSYRQLSRDERHLIDCPPKSRNMSFPTPRTTRHHPMHQGSVAAVESVFLSAIDRAITLKSRSSRGCQLTFFRRAAWPDRCSNKLLDRLPLRSSEHLGRLSADQAGGCFMPLLTVVGPGSEGREGGWGGVICTWSRFPKAVRSSASKVVEFRCWWLWRAIEFDMNR